MPSRWLSPANARALAMVAASLLVSPCHHMAPRKLVVGVQSEPMGGVVGALHVVVKVDDAVVTDVTEKPPHGSRVGFPQPWEGPVLLPAEREARVDVTVEALPKDPMGPSLTRIASARVGAGPSPLDGLLRVPLEARCLVYPPPPPGARVPGPLSGPTCRVPFTCIQGVCQSSAVPPANLEAYAPNWPTNAPDRCKGRNAGPPALQVGTGQTDYLPLTPGQTLQAEAGPQGGHHIWIAARMKNLKQSLTTTRIEGVQPDTGTTIPPSTFVFTYTPGEGGYCKLSGLRYQLDNGGIDYKQFLGKPLDVTVTLTDPAGTTAKTTARIQVAPTLVNP